VVVMWGKGLGWRIVCIMLRRAGCGEVRLEWGRSGGGWVWWCVESLAGVSVGEGRFGMEKVGGE